MPNSINAGLDLKFIDENLMLKNFESLDPENTQTRTISKTSETSYSSMDTSDSLNPRNQHQRKLSDSSILAEIFPNDYKTRLDSVKVSRMNLSLDSDGMLKFPPLGKL